MICLNNTDTLEGGASVNAVVDYTVHGLVGSTFTKIANGQLSNTNPSVLYTAAAAISIVAIILVNTHSATVTVDLYIDPGNAGTPRRLIPKTLSLGVGYSAHFDGQRLTILDASGRIATSLPQSLGTTDSPTFVGETLSGLTASLPVFTGASKELVSKSIVDTRTALGLTYDSILPWTIHLNVFMTAKSNVNWDTNVTDANQLGGGYKQSSGVQNDEITWDVVLAAGTWKVELFHVEHFDLGIYSVQFDSVEKGTIDGYKATPAAYNVRDSVTGIVVPTTAKIELKLKMATKNASATAYSGIIAGISLIRTA